MEYKSAFKKLTKEGVDRKKDEWWNKNHKELIEVASDYEFDDWMNIFDNEEDVDAIMDSTGKHKAQALLGIFSIKDLEDIIK